ncbi:hemerythrin domain-containing protein [Actinokineospora auranticolor]|uniref:Hemerythrin HHE cation binding domain-containing protein n=1 Tax=Actinokineospora auranticolor TaxID=155976 RepID=A0A2S6H0K4_9PSEU|nr:hemerythrin domain-containing protein [Actinokineospora auranticolor]PPK70956.1 hemerythrin HHE cation binding domain-containing protein [Actinokineospora auranticolor]
MSNDVIELILADHRRFEDLFRKLRDNSQDRPAALRELARLLVAHAEAEESEVYPALRRFHDVDDHEVEHGAEEHAEGHQALLALMELDGPESDDWDDKLEELVKAINHHLDEEERTILNAARDTVPEQRRAELGARFVEVRDERVAAGCGDLAHVRELVEATKDRVD